MLTQENARDYLSQIGVELPEFILAALLEKVHSANECLEANYSAADIVLIQTYLLSLMALAQWDKTLSSRSAPNGASQSFRFQSFNDRWRGLMALLGALDTKGCVSHLIPADPTVTARAMLYVATGGCHE